MRALSNWVPMGFVGGVAALLLLSCFGGPQAFANPVCDDQNWQPLAYNNDQVLQWKQTTPSSWRGRANVVGYVVGIEPDATGHNHFILQIGPNVQTDVVEIIYSYEFGNLPQIQVGMELEACGDFIQSTQQNGPYPPSPAGAIIHWLHVDPEQRHPDGFILVNGQVYGSDLTNAR